MSNLTKKQKVVYEMMKSTLNYHQMEDILGLSKGGVRFHVADILLKLNYTNRTELLSDYYEQIRKPEDLHYNCGLKLDEIGSAVFQCMVKGFTSAEISSIVQIEMKKILMIRKKIIQTSKVNNVLELAFIYYKVGGYAKGGEE
jgi:DNA-binding CsgD family transcriptional regulator